MAKDYARNTRPNHAKSKKSKNSHSKMWAFTILLVLLFVGGLFYLKQHEALAVFKNGLQHQAYSKHAKQQKKPQEVKPRFEFYTILPKMNVEDSQAQNQPDKPAATTQKPAAAQPPKSVDKTVAPQQANNAEEAAPVRSATPVKAAANKYIIQVASFKSFNEADRLKAEMLMMGQTVDVKAFSHKGEKWYRVQLGPYTSLTAAQKAQQQLKANNIKAIVRKAG